MTVNVLLSISAFLTVFFLVLGLPPIVHPAAVRSMDRWQTWFRRALDDVFLHKITPNEAIGLVAAGAIVVPVIVYPMSGSWVLALAASAGVLLSPKAILEYLKRERRVKFEEQLPAMLDHIASSTKAGLNLVQAFEEASQQMSPPASQELSLIVQDYRLGRNLKSSIESARQRLKSRPFNLVASALGVNIDQGGNLPEAMVTMSSSLKEIWRLEQKMLTASAEGRKAVKLISGMPIMIFLLVALTQPDIVETLTSNFAGWIIITVSVAVYVFAIYWLIRILQTDI